MRETDAQGEVAANGPFNGAGLRREHVGVTGLNRHHGRTQVEIAQLVTNDGEGRQRVGSKNL
ncbi:unannotated protein [freshwater metagenome]|uniref:Unannotated protein n=1 Tax=freshwater metagenome TaxID=449393 RepID=A0A6J6W9W3_9ZZZZ